MLGTSTNLHSLVSSRGNNGSAFKAHRVMGKGAHTVVNQIMPNM